MLQCFNNRKFISSFQPSTIPRLAYSCKTEEHHVNMPRNMHMHENIMEIVFIESGEGTHIIGDVTYNTQKGDLLLYNSNVLHDEIATSSGELNTYCLGITDLHYLDLPVNTLIPPQTTAVYSTNDQFDTFVHLFELIHSTNISSSHLASECLTYLVQSVILMVESLISNCIHQPHKSKEEEMEYRIKEYLNSHYLEEISLNSISKALHLSPYYISHLFKQSEGTSPMKYIIRRRIGEAQSLLINTELSITDIALHVGYKNPTHFHSSFLKNVGLTPSSYRKYWTVGMENIESPILK